MPEEIQDFPRTRPADRPEVEWLKAPAVRLVDNRAVDGIAVTIGPTGHYVKVKKESEINVIIEDGSIP